MLCWLKLVDLPAPSNGWCEKTLRGCFMAPWDPFGTPWKLQVMKRFIKEYFHVEGIPQFQKNSAAAKKTKVSSLNV